MSKRDDGGPAFPLDRVAGSVNCGMTMRQWYKGMAMTAALQHEAILKRIAYQEGENPGPSVARFCGEVADALIAEDKEAEK